VLRDLFHTVAHPAGQGRLSAILTRFVWRVSHRLGGIRARTLAAHLSHLRRLDATRTLPGLEGSLPATILEDLAKSIAQIHVDLTQYPETFYFRDRDATTALPRWLTFAAALAPDVSTRDGCLLIRTDGAGPGRRPPPR
jgi:hypothetical protein